MTTQTNSTNDNATAEFARIVANFRTEAWKEIGRVDAEALGPDLLECGYSNPNSSSTAWDDRRPTEADELYRADGRFELDADEAELRETLLSEARTAYNAGFNEAEQEAEDAADGDRSGTIHVFGGDLGETQFCRVDSRGSFDGGPEIDDQDDIEAAIRSGATSGKTDAGHTWYYSDRR